VRPWTYLGLIASVLLLAPAISCADDETIPQTNRPANFSGAAGLYTIHVRATPTTVRVEDPITLTVKVVSQKPGPWKYPPQRDKLKLFPASLESEFFVEPLPEEDRFLSAENAWEFRWRLLPKHDKVARIPEPEFVFYRTVEPQNFAVAEGAASIPLDVKPRVATILTGPSATRERLQAILEGDGLLAQGPSDVLWWTLVIAGLVLPPVACLAAYFLWRQLFPEAAERLRRRRSRALKTALSQLRRLDQAPPEQVRGVVVDYLRAHLHLAPGEPTPTEVKQALLPQGVPDELAEQTVMLLTACDTARFAPLSKPHAENLPASASRLMQSLEAKLCASS
jgi:hypothetical protein